MTIEEMKQRKIELGLTNEMVAELADLPLSTVQKIFAGITKAPRKATIDALSAVLSATTDTSGPNTAVDGDGRPENSASPADRPLYGHSAVHANKAHDSFTDDKEAEWHRIHEQYIEDTFLQNLTPADLKFAKLLGKTFPSPDGMVRESAGQYGSALPKRSKCTIDDYYALPDDQRAELIDGHFYDMGAPTVIHQMLLARLQYLFMECIERHEMPCIALQSPCDVRLDKDNYTMVQPDLMVVCHGFDTNAIRYEGAPDLVVEVLSPSSRMKDMVLKLHKYQRAGVREYWIVDPKNQTVTVHNFTDPNYDPQKYTFADKIPVGISDGQCSIDFSRIQEWLSRFDSRNS